MSQQPLEDLCRVRKRMIDYANSLMVEAVHQALSIQAMDDKEEMHIARFYARICMETARDVRFGRYKHIETTCHWLNQWEDCVWDLAEASKGK